MDTKQAHKAFSETVEEVATLHNLVGELRTKLEASTTRTYFWRKKFENLKEKDSIIRAQNMALLTKVDYLQSELVEKQNQLANLDEV
jgi:thiamine kinase-like enzyme